MTEELAKLAEDSTRCSFFLTFATALAAVIITAFYLSVYATLT